MTCLQGPTPVLARVPKPNSRPPGPFCHVCRIHSWDSSFYLTDGIGDCHTRTSDACLFLPVKKMASSLQILRSKVKGLLVTIGGTKQ